MQCNGQLQEGNGNAVKRAVKTVMLVLLYSITNILARAKNKKNIILINFNIRLSFDNPVKTVVINAYYEQLTKAMLNL